LTLGPDQLADFLNPPPAQVTLSGYALTNPDYAVVTVTSGDEFMGTLKLISPLALAFRDTASILPGITHADIDHNSRPSDFKRYL